MFGEFFLIERDGQEPQRGERLAFGDTADRNEAWLRDTLFQNPQLLPVREIDPAFGPLVPLCTELGTEAGPLDAAFVNPHGRLTLVECKLWRNPEARRKVVAQVLDYARAISRWSYADLQRRVAKATGRKDNAPFELVRSAHPEVSEADFVDATSNAMRSGRFLLLIAGDGIREDVGAIGELINRNSASAFSFGMVEMALYGFEDGALAIQPRTVAKTVIIERTVVVLKEPSGALRAVDPDEISEAPPRGEGANALGEGAKQAAYRAWWQPVLDVVFDDPAQDSPRLFYPNNVRVFLPWPRTWLLAYRNAANASCGITLIESGTNRRLSELLTPLQPEILSQLAGAEVSRSDASVFSNVRPMYSFASDDDAKTWISSTLNAYVNVLRPILRRIALEHDEAGF